MSLAEVSAILWRERELLELLLFKLEEEQLVLASGRTRWLGRASAEVELFLDEIRKVELVRAVEVAATARALDHEGELSLAKLAQLSDQPWQDLLLDHRAAFLTLADEIHAMAKHNRELLGAGLQATREVLLGFGDGASTYTHTGASVNGSTPPRLVDEAF
jgi:hypothetical protein